MRALALLPLLLAAPALAQEVGPCDSRASAAHLMEPWEETTRTFAGGRTRIAVLDTIEPALGAFHLLVISPPFDEVGGRQCRVVSYQGTMGFAGMRLDRMDASYNPATGLALAVPVQVPDANGLPADATLHVLLNQGTGAITTELSQ